jgi:hypothetical protein
VRRRPSPNSKPPEAGTYEFVEGGAILRRPPAVYAAIAQLPPLAAEDQVNSTQHFFGDLNRLGSTNAIDAGATGTPYPRDYQVLEKLAARPSFPSPCRTLRVELKPQMERELADLTRLMSNAVGLS